MSDTPKCSVCGMDLNVHGESCVIGGQSELVPAAGSATKSMLGRGENSDLAEELLSRFPVDRGELLKDMVAWAFFEMRHGNKREERAACEFLNELQHKASLNAEKSQNDKLTERPRTASAPH